MYAPTALYFYKVLFTVELLVAECLICRGMKRRGYFALRLAATIVLCIGAAFAIPIAAYNALYCSFVFIVIFCISMLGMWFCYAENGVSILFRAIAAYTTQHIAYQIFDLISLGIAAMFGEGTGIGGAYGSDAAASFVPVIFNALRSPETSVLSGSFDSAFFTLFSVVAYIFTYTITYYASALFVMRKLKDSNKFELKNSAVFIFIAFFVLFNIVVSALVTYYSGPKFDAFYVVLLGLYNVCSSFFTIYLMIEIVYRKQFERDYRASDRLLKQSSEQYALAKRNVELINMKCDDMKHQIRSVVGKEISPAAVKEIDEIISVYDANIRTGNETLDVILTEKSLYCKKHDIKLYCIVDGKLLGFMSDADLYSLFGNIMDNAIEAVRPLERKQRFVNLSVRRVNGFTCITESNCLSKELEFSDGLPKSTKGNDDIHGYGMKSIRYVCKKYNAELAIAAARGKFDLTVLFM